MYKAINRLRIRARLCAVAACCCAAGVLNTTQAQYTALPVIPEQVLSITDFGAAGDGTTLNTKAIQQALDKAAVKGGQVTIPAGIFLCGPLTLYSKTHLLLQKGAVLRLRNDIDSFPSVQERYLNFITVSGAADIKISGEGTIDGQGELWWKKFTAKEISRRRPQMLFIEKSSRIEIAGITFLNPPNTHLSLKSTADVYIHGICIQAPATSRNTDGINISARNCTIEDCDIRTGDDNIAINFGSRHTADGAPECSNILIRKCFFGVGHGLSIGSYTAGGLRNLQVSQCVFDSTTSGIRIKSARGRGGVVENISYSSIVMDHVKWPVFISAYYPREPEQPQDDTTTVPVAYTPLYRNIVLKDIKIANATDAVKLWGLPEAPVEGITFEDVHIATRNGLQIYHAKQVQFIRSQVIAEKGQQVKTYRAEVKGL